MRNFLSPLVPLSYPALCNAGGGGKKEEADSSVSAQMTHPKDTESGHLPGCHEFVWAQFQTISVISETHEPGEKDSDLEKFCKVWPQMKSSIFV